MDVLCTDKTGTLTMDKVVLEYHLDVHGNEDTRVLRHAFLNSYYQTGLKNLMDISIIDRTEKESAKAAALQGLSTSYVKVDEIPFDFERRRMIFSQVARPMFVLFSFAASFLILFRRVAETQPPSRPNDRSTGTPGSAYFRMLMNRLSKTLRTAMGFILMVHSGISEDSAIS